MEQFNEIINSDKPVLVDFFATWCGPCQMMHPVLEELQSMVGETARILKVDIDKNMRLAAQYQVRSVPTLMIFQNGDELFVQGAVPRRKVHGNLVSWNLDIL